MLGNVLIRLLKSHRRIEGHWVDGRENGQGGWLLEYTGDLAIYIWAVAT